MKKIFILSIILTLLICGCSEKENYDEYAWVVPEIKNETSDEYYSKLHVYYQRAENQLMFKEKVENYYFVCDYTGITLKYTPEGKEEKSCLIAEGNYADYTSALLYDDGFWFYFYKTENGENKQLVRVNLNGEKQIIIDDISDSGIITSGGYITGMKILDHNVMLAVYDSNGKTVIKRVYLPDMKTEVIETPLIYGAELIEQINSEHIYYEGLNPEYLRKYEELKENKELAGSLYDKHINAELYANSKDDYLKSYTGSICAYILYQEYNLNMYATFDYDFQTGNTTIYPIETVVSYPEFPQDYVPGEK